MAVDLMQQETQPARAPETSPFQNSILKSAMKMALGTLTSRSLGLLREIAFAALFSRTITDAWSAAFRLPNMFRRLLGEGSLSVSFIPVFVESRFQDGKAQNTEDSKKFVSAMFMVLFCILTVLTVLGILFSEQILNLLLDENYKAIPGKLELTVRMAKIMFGFIFLMSMFGFFMGILNALGIFGLPAMAPTLFNLAMIVSTLLPQNWFPEPGDGLAWGVLAGGLLQMGILLPTLRRHGYLPKIRLQFSHPLVSKVFLNMLPGLLGMGLLQVTTLVNLKFASELGEGVISYIYWADRLLELPLSLVSVSLGTALLPSLAGLWSGGQAAKFSETVSDYLKINLYAALPAAAGLFFLAQPIVELIFMRGQFTVNDAVQTAAILQVYSFILISSSCVRVLVPAYYAVKNTWFPAVVSGVCLVGHILLAPIMMSAYGVWGLNISTLLSGGLNFVLLMLFYTTAVTGIRFLPVLVSLGKYLVPTAVLSLICLSWPYLLPHFEFLGVTLSRLLLLGILIPAAGLSFIWISQLMGLQEYERTFGRLVGRVLRRR